ncbi:MAG TPA: Dyp-type peroxidase [Nitrososphaeraceae archaeon]|nr:Dyp-type peroxidase [Nitrososphaeraceae archaeon]
MTANQIPTRYIRNKRLEQLARDKRKQAGVEYPKAGQQDHILIVRLNLASTSSANDANALRREVQDGLRRLCGLFERIESAVKKIDMLDSEGNLSSSPLKQFNFSATVGFGVGFFDRLSIPNNKRPRRIKSMPDHVGLGDITPYSLGQTDLLIQLGSTSDFVNRWVFENKIEARAFTSVKSEQHLIDGNESQDVPDIVTAIGGWATIADIHAGFQRIDGRNLMGFNDGISNPTPGSGIKFDDVVWTTEKDEGRILKDGTYMVFQKIEHDLDQWRQLSAHEQEQWVGRNKVTGLLLGTPENEDQKFIEALKKQDPKAKQLLRRLLDNQSDPEKLFYNSEIFRNSVPAWSHVRKANPRQEKMPSGKELQKKIIFRRGYPFMEAGLNNRTISGLLFVCFQRDIENSFEFIKRNWLNNKDFPTPDVRPFTQHEKNKRSSQARFTPDEMRLIKNLDISKRKLLGLHDREVLEAKIRESTDHDTQNTGREGLAGPSELGVVPTGDLVAIVPFGGGYYFIPPVPNRRISDIGQQFF